MTNPIGYFGGCKPNSNSAITLGYGVYGVTEIQNTKTAALTVAAGVVGGIDIEDGSTTYGISLYGLGPAVDTGTLTNAMTCYLAAATGGSTTWGLMSEDDVQVNSGKKLLLEGALGTKGDTYFVYDAAGGTIDCFVNNTEMFNVSSTASTFLNGLVIPSGTTPAPAVAGALFLDTDASANGDLMCYANGAWRTVAVL